MLILYFSWDGLRGKRLGFWVYLEVKTVGTAVPGTVMSTVQEVKAAENKAYDDLTADQKAQVDEAMKVLQDNLSAIKAEMPAYYSYMSGSADTNETVANAFNTAVATLNVLGNTTASYGEFLASITSFK